MMIRKIALSFVLKNFPWKYLNMESCEFIAAVAGFPTMILFPPSLFGVKK